MFRLTSFARGAPVQVEAEIGERDVGGRRAKEVGSLSNDRNSFTKNLKKRSSEVNAKIARLKNMK